MPQLTTAWLIGVARHKLVDHWRRQARDERNLRAVADEPAPDDDPWDAHLDAAVAHEVLGRLGAHHRSALTLRYLDGLLRPRGGRAPRPHRPRHRGAARARPAGVPPSLRRERRWLTIPSTPSASPRHRWPRTPASPPSCGAGSTTCSTPTHREGTMTATEPALAPASALRPYLVAGGAGADAALGLLRRRVRRAGRRRRDPRRRRPGRPLRGRHRRQRPLRRRRLPRVRHQRARSRRRRVAAPRGGRRRRHRGPGRGRRRHRAPAGRGSLLRLALGHDPRPVRPPVADPTSPARRPMRRGGDGGRRLPPRDGRPRRAGAGRRAPTRTEVAAANASAPGVGYFTIDAPDAPRAAAFFGALLGWRTHVSGQGFHIENVSPPGGIDGSATEPGVTLFLRVDDAAALGRARAASSAAPSCPRRSTPPAAARTCLDDQGVPFTLWQPAPGY